MDDLLQEFLTETNESLGALDVQLVQFEQNPHDTGTLGNIFRLMHTIKGTCGFLGLPRLESVAHAGENVLGKFRDGQLEVTPAAVSAILGSIDKIRELLGGLEATGEEPAGDDASLVAELNAMAEGKSPATSAGATADATDAADDDAVEIAVDGIDGISVPKALTANDIDLVRDSFAQVAPITEKTVEIFYGRLFEISPHLKSLFHDDAKRQGQMLIDTISRVVAGLDDPDSLIAGIEELGERHDADRVQEGDYDAIGEALLWTLETGLGGAFTTEVREAWARVYRLAAVVMIRAADAAKHRAANASRQRSTAAAPLPKNEFGAPVAQDLLDEVNAAIAAGKRAATGEEIAREMQAERKKESMQETKTEVAKPAPKPAAAAPAVDDGKAPKESAAAQASIRVNVDVLEGLMTLVSELVLTRNQLLQMVRGLDESEFTGPLQRLSHITTDLQEGVMKTRMQPIGNAWAKLPRIVRDLSIETKKKIDLKMIGAETELDRQVLELIKDPLTHMVRNSADHGIEPPEDRKHAGKPETGSITLNAFHEGGHIIIEIADDGRGLNTDRIRAKCLERGLATETDLAAMSDRQVQQFIFKAGFSTAEKVTNVSGRGVGMDVVRTNIETIGGTIEFQSTAGKGSSFTIKIPLTLAIVSGLIVACGGERFAIPQISVLELVRIAEGSAHGIETIDAAQVLRLRDRLLPLISLSNLFKLEGNPETEKGDEMFIVVTQVGSRTFGIIVDQVFDTEEIVVKPVAPILRDIPYYSGNTILGDGSVIMILDPNGIADGMGNVDAKGEAQHDDGAATLRAGDRAAFLVFTAGGEDLLAVPLGLIARLEEIDFAEVEHAHGQNVIQYRGKLMPLIPCQPNGTVPAKGNKPVIVFADEGRSMGLVVDEIVDIVEDNLNVELKADKPGLLGAAIIGGKTTEIIDVNHYLDIGFPDWFDRPIESTEGENYSHTRRILLVDDSSFFRNLLAPYLSAAGYEVTTAPTGDEALRLRETGQAFDIIVSDIEMPGISGFELAEAIRADERWRNVPMIALSSCTNEDLMKRGRQAGFSAYVPKTQRQDLVRILNDALKQFGQAA